jgi:hypothetical protein
MTECFACGINFDVKFEEETAKLNYCPYCGQETVDEIDLLDEETDYTENGFDDDY